MQRGLPRSLSDHNPIFLREEGNDWGQSPFQFNNWWLEEKDMMGEAIRGWKECKVTGSRGFVIFSKVKASKNRMKNWFVANKRNSAHSKDSEEKFNQIDKMTAREGCGDQANFWTAMLWDNKPLVEAFPRCYAIAIKKKGIIKDFGRIFVLNRSRPSPNRILDWIPPVVDNFKFNVDGSSRVRAIKRDVELVHSKPNLHNRETVIARDSKSAVSLVNNGAFGSLNHVDMIYDIRSIMNSVLKMAAVYDSRAFNAFADSLAKHGSSMGGETLQ
ncbi:hypothetical protein Dsin_013168 [Dipteronia sinensis]|uniref:Uncharacterized protein n=1 Tax=Dipteronia sinensis TaxID=43782 RepID=A0AAE0AJX7_9ROSI|nr:hypothetical protein Dsin_013168 [Dipteronia sinensis]